MPLTKSDFCKKKLCTGETEQEQGFEHKERIKELKKQLNTFYKEQKIIEKKWRQEKKLINKNSYSELGENPLISLYVDYDAVAKVIADWTGIPIGRMLKDEINQIIGLKNHLQKRIKGQDGALKIIASALRTSSAKLSDPNKPLGVFLFIWPSGVGKTETALVLAEVLYNSEQKITVINMSEFKEEHKISMLAGSPPGYVDYGEGGVSTEAVRRNPWIFCRN